MVLELKCASTSAPARYWPNSSLALNPFAALLTVYRGMRLHESGGVDGGSEGGLGGGGRGKGRDGGDGGGGNGEEKKGSSHDIRIGVDARPSASKLKVCCVVISSIRKEAMPFSDPKRVLPSTADTWMSRT